MAIPIRKDIRILMAVVIMILSKQTVITWVRGMSTGELV